MHIEYQFLVYCLVGSLINLKVFDLYYALLWLLFKDEAKPYSIFHNDDSNKKLFNMSTASSFVITQHEESIYERPDIKSIYRRMVILELDLEENRWFLSNIFTLEKVTIELWCRYIQYSEVMDYVTVHIDHKSIWIKSVTVMLLEKHITLLTINQHCTQSIIIACGSCKHDARTRIPTVTLKVQR